MIGVDKWVVTHLSTPSISICCLLVFFLKIFLIPIFWLSYQFRCLSNHRNIRTNISVLVCWTFIQICSLAYQASQNAVYVLQAYTIYNNWIKRLTYLKKSLLPQNIFHVCFHLMRSLFKPFSYFTHS